MSRWNRTNFYRKEIVNGHTENDLVMNYFNDVFTITRPLRYYAMEDGDVQRPDLVSIKFYGTDKYWWIISKFNQIDDWWNDIEIDQIISVPSIADIEDFYTAVKRKKKDENK